LLQITISNQIWIRGATVPLRSAITKALEIDNPVYIEKQKKRQKVWGIEKKLKLYRLEGSDIVCPRGFLKDLKNIMQQQNIPLDIILEQYNDTKAVDFGEWNTAYSLKDDQLPAVAAMMQQNGVLIAPAGSGKTVMGLKYVHDTGKPTIWLTHTKDLLEQTIAKAQAVSGDIGRVGRIADGVVDYGDGKLIVAMAQTLSQRPELIEALDPLIGNVVVDECLAGDTLITLADGTAKPIADVMNGDLVVGGVVSNKFQRTGLVYEVVTQNGKLNCTDTHKHIVYKKEFKTYSKGGYVPPDGDCVQAIQTKDLTEGDYLLLPLSTPHVEKSEWTPEQLAFVALICTDGHIEKNLSRVKVAVRTDLDYYRRVFKAGLTAFGYGSSYKESINCRGDLTLWSANKEIITTLMVTFAIPAGKKAYKLVITDTVFTAPSDALRGFITTVFAAEGAVVTEKNGCQRLILDMTAYAFLEQMRQLLMKFGVHARTLSKKPADKLKGHNDVHRITIRGQDLINFIENIGNLGNSRKTLARFSKQRTFYTDREITYKGLPYRLTAIKKVSPLHGTAVYDFTTTDHTFIANGILTHNCHHTPSTTFIEVLNKFKARRIMGLTATPERKDMLQEYMYRAIGPEVYRITRDGLYESGRLIKPEIKFVYSDFDYEPASVRNGTSVDAGGEELDYHDLIQHLIVDDDRAILIADTTLNNLKQGFTIVVSESIKYAHKLHGLILERAAERGFKGIRTAVVHGPISQCSWRVARSEFAAQELMQQGKAVAYRFNAKAKRWEIKVENYTESEMRSWQCTPLYRKQVMEESRAGKLDILIASSIAKEGLDLPNLCVGLLAIPQRGDTGSAKNGIGVEQTIGRIQRPDPRNPEKKALWIDIVDANVGVFKSQYYSRRKVYQRLGLTVPKKPRTNKDDIEAFLDGMKWD